MLILHDCWLFLLALPSPTKGKVPSQSHWHRPNGLLLLWPLITSERLLGACLLHWQIDVPSPRPLGKLLLFQSIPQKMPSGCFKAAGTNESQFSSIATTCWQECFCCATLYQGTRAGVISIHAFPKNTHPIILCTPQLSSQWFPTLLDSITFSDATSSLIIKSLLRDRKIYP